MRLSLCPDRLSPPVSGRSGQTHGKARWRRAADTQGTEAVQVPKTGCPRIAGSSDASVARPGHHGRDSA